MLFKTPFFYEINGHKAKGKSGDCLLHRSGTFIAHGPLSEHTSFINDWIHFSFDDEESEFLSILPIDRPVHIDDSKIFEHLLTEIAEESFLKDEYSDRLISNNIYSLLVLLSRADNEQRKDALYTQFEEIRTHIIRHLSQKWTLEDMAKLSNYSISRFCTLYSLFFGTSPLNDLIENRLKTAKQLLAIHSHKIGDIAQMCGFSSIHYFSKFFKMHTGKSPNQYYK